MAGASTITGSACTVKIPPNSNIDKDKSKRDDTNEESALPPKFEDAKKKEKEFEKTEERRQ